MQLKCCNYNYNWAQQKGAQQSENSQKAQPDGQECWGWLRGCRKGCI